MNNLRLLQFDEGHRVYPPDEGFESFPDELRCFNWIGYPSKSFPLGLCTENLVELNFYGSKLQGLWDGVQDLPSLKILNLYGSHELIELPDLCKAPNLRYVNLLGCLELNHVPFWPNVEQDSKGCEEPKTSSVERSQISITSLGTEESEEDGQLDLCETSLPIKSCFNYYVFPFLEELLISGCHKLTELPDIIHLCLPSLRVLELTGTMVETLPENIKHLSQLTKLRLSYCPRLRHIPELPPSIKYFTANECGLLDTLQFTWNSMHLSLLPIVFVIELRNCVKLDDPALEAIARHYKLTAQKIMSANIEGCQTELYIPGSKLPECFSNCRTTQVSASIPFELPLHCRKMGFIFCFVISPNVDDFFGFRIKCHIELRNVAKVQFLYNCHPKVDLLESADHTLFWYESSLSFKIMQEVSRIKASASTDDQYAVVWFELADMTSYWCGVKECRVYPVFIPSKSPKRFQNTNDNGKSDDDDDDV